MSPRSTLKQETMELLNVLQELNFNFERINANQSFNQASTKIELTLSSIENHSDEFYDVLKYLADNNLMSSQIECNLNYNYLNLNVGNDTILTKEITLVYQNDPSIVTKITERFKTLLTKRFQPKKSLPTFKFK
jgi:hypothetical protein